MMRLQRIGRKNAPSFRVIVTDSRNAAKRGLNVDLLGSYDPKLGKFQIDGEKAKHWISKGVQVSDTVHNFLVSEKIIEGKKKNVLSRKSPIVDEAKLKAEAEAKAAAEKAEADAKAQAEADAKAADEAAKADAEAAAAPAPAPAEETETVAAPTPEVVAEAAPEITAAVETPEIPATEPTPEVLAEEATAETVTEEKTS